MHDGILRLTETMVARAISGSPPPLGIGRTQLYRLLQSGEIHSISIGHPRRIPSDEIERFMRDQP